jgi:hypothetical protein
MLEPGSGHLNKSTVALYRSDNKGKGFSAPKQENVEDKS